MEEGKLGVKFVSLHGRLDAEGFVAVHFPDSAEEKVTSDARGSPVTGFDPKTLLASFTDTLGDLRKLQQKMDHQISTLCDASHDKNKQYCAEIVTHKRSQQDIFGAMRQLDERFKNVGTIAVQIGDQLSGLDKQRQRAADTKTLLQYFEGFNRVEKDGTGGIDPVFTDPSRLHESTEATQQLMRIVTGLNLPGTEEAIHQIESTSEQVKAQLLEHFTASLRLHSRGRESKNVPGDAPSSAQSDGDLKQVKDFANALLKYDSSDNLHNCYVYNVLQEQFSSGPQNRTEFSELYARVETVCRYEKHVIRAVFPPLSAATVYQLLLERVFIDPAFGIQAKVEACIKPPRQQQARSAPSAPSVPSGSADWQMEADYLVLLTSVYHQTTLLVDSLLSMKPYASDGMRLEPYASDGGGNNTASNPTVINGFALNGFNDEGGPGEAPHMISREFLEGQVNL
jgi:hypothetical protein